MQRARALYILVAALGTASMASVAPVGRAAEAAPGADDDAPMADTATLPSLELFRPEGQGDEDDIGRLLNLGRIQQANEEYAAAIETFEEGLALIEDEHGIWDQRNVTALVGLGQGYKAIGRYRKAREFFDRAVYVNRMNEGLHDPSQLEMLDSLTEIHAELNDWERANDLQEYAYYVQAREYGGSAPEIVPAMYRLADWYRRTGAVYSARGLYEDALVILEQHYGADDVRLVDALQGLAATYRLERFPVTPPAAQKDASFQINTDSSFDQRREVVVENRAVLNRYGDGEDALERAVTIYERNPEVPARQRAEAILELADWYLVFDKWNQAFDTYGRARRFLREQGWAESDIDALFDDPKPLVFPLPAAPSPPPWADQVEERHGYVELAYDVTDRGRVRNIDVVDSQPEGSMEFRTRKSIREARYRPRFTAGEPVDTERVQYRHSFVYYEQPED